MVSHKIKLSTIAIGIMVGLSACGSTRSPNGNYRIDSKELSVVQANVDKEILESAERIERQLNLLNDTLRHKETGIRAGARVPSNMNVREITQNDVKLMATEGRTTNNPPKSFDQTLEYGVVPVREEYKPTVPQSITAENNFYKQPVQSPSQRVTGIREERQVQTPTSVSSNSQQSNWKPIPLTSSSRASQGQGQSQTQTHKTYRLDRTVELFGSYKSTQLLKTLSEGAGFQFKVVGADRNLDIIIGKRDNNGNEQRFNGTIKDALINIGNILGDKALVNVDMRTGVVTLEYK